MNDVMASIEATRMEFTDAFRDELTWKWVGRFDAVLTAFQTENQESVKSLLERHLKTVRDNSPIAQVPDAVPDVICHFGGLIPGQLLFNSGLEEETLLLREIIDSPRLKKNCTVVFKIISHWFIEIISNNTEKGLSNRVPYIFNYTNFICF